MSGDNDTELTYVCFTKGKHRWKKFLKKDFEHVFILTKQENRWVKIEPLFEGFLQIKPKLIGYIKHARYDPEPVSGFKSDNPFDFIDEEAIIISWKVNFKKVKHIKLRIGFISCVSLIKRVLAIKSYSITPYGLYKWLLNNGGVIYDGR